MVETAPIKVQDLEPENEELLVKYFADRSGNCVKLKSMESLSTSRPNYVRVKASPLHAIGGRHFDGYALYDGQPGGYAYFGDKRFVLPKIYKDHVEGIRNMPLRKDDVWVATFPRSGTTWTQELTWLLCNDLDYKRAAAETLTKRFVFIEFPSFFPKEILGDPSVLESLGDEIFIDYISLKDAPSPRFIKTHLPMSLLPPQLLNTSRVVYVARDPRDVAVSYYHHNKLFKMIGFNSDFKDYWKLFVKNLVNWAPYFEHLKEAWAQRNHPNMLFIFYEELYKNLPDVVKRIANFVGKTYSDEQIQVLCEHLKIDKMKENKSIQPDWMQNPAIITEGAEGFIRKGKAGGWREYFDEEMSAEAETWIQENLRGTDFRFSETNL
ncbi:Sulfotransferase family cytosolic 1B member 1 [Eumeta japonica]|uniref:Sulfotransferase family cytosolic 1B member 1 n=1 Tax=Eumeta variegata TaxID=151549 RepID=A0A4C1UNU4_EUMVA|nr:Sulfotransferase family cytosolic 1B member 1 [Eumeta japonica]